MKYLAVLEIETPSFKFLFSSDLTQTALYDERITTVLAILNEIEAILNKEPSELTTIEIEQLFTAVKRMLEDALPEHIGPFKPEEVLALIGVAKTFKQAVEVDPVPVLPDVTFLWNPTSADTCLLGPTQPHVHMAVQEIVVDSFRDPHSDPDHWFSRLKKIFQSLSPYLPRHEVVTFAILVVALAAGLLWSFGWPSSTIIRSLESLVSSFSGAIYKLILQAWQSIKIAMWGPVLLIACNTMHFSKE